MTTDLILDDPCVLFAMARESAPFRREFPVQQSFPEAPVWARFCGPTWLTVCVMHTGVGANRMSKTLDWLFNNPTFGNLPYKPKVILSAGFAGGLEDSYQVGDVLLASEVANTRDNVWPTTWPTQLPDEPFQPPLKQGRLLTAPKIVGKPEDKRALGKQFSAVAVDMESSLLAEQCAKRRIPFGCLRVISDDAQTTLSPQLTQLLSGGNVSSIRAMFALMRNPFLAGEFYRLSKNTRLAAERLGKALGELLTLTLSWSDELDRSF